MAAITRSTQWPGRQRESNELPLLLLEKDGDVTLVDIEGRNVLHYALDYNSADGLFEKFLEHPSAQNLVNQKNREGLTPMHYALMHGFSCHEPCRLLMAAGVNILEPDPKGNGPLHLLAKFIATEAPPLWEDCLLLGADINSKNNSGETPLMIWLKNYTLSSFQTLQDRRQGFTAAFAGSDVHVRNERGENCLHVMAAQRTMTRRQTGEDTKIKDCFKMFMDMGVDPLAQDEGQQTPLDVAAVSGYAGILELFDK